ncbi:MAG: class I tRNA ligase family protein [Bacteroidia bacterium]
MLGSDSTIVAQFTVLKTKRQFNLWFAYQRRSAPLAWTTTPWTLPSNTALSVGANITYAAVRTYNMYSHEPVTVILAEALIPNHFSAAAAGMPLSDYKAGDKQIPWEVAGTFKGSELAGLRMNSFFRMRNQLMAMHLR